MMIYFLQELVIALQRTGDPGQLSSLRPQLELLAGLDPSPESLTPDWELCASSMDSIKAVVLGLVQFIQHHGNRRITDTHHAHNAKYKTSMCRDLTQRGGCPRGHDCTFAHSEEELENFRSRNRKSGKSSMISGNKIPVLSNTSASISNNNHHNSNVNNTKHHREILKCQQHIEVSQGGTNKSLSNGHHKPTDSKYNSPITPPLSPRSNHHNCNSIISSGHSLSSFSASRGSGHRPLTFQTDRTLDRNSVRPVLGKHVVVEEIIAPIIGHPHHPQNLFENKFLPATQAPMPVLQTAVRPTLSAQPTAPTAVYATPINDYAAAAAFGSFHHPQGPIFAAATPGLPTPGMATLPTPGGPTTPVFQPQHPSSLLPEMFTPNPQPTLLVNQGGQVYNLMNTARDFNAAVAETQQTNSFASDPMLSSWSETVAHNNVNGSSAVSNEVNFASQEEMVASKSLNELTERKDEILSQLENILGKQAIHEVATRIENGESVPTSSPPEYTSTYSIWTSGADFSNWVKKQEKDSNGQALGYRTDAEAVKSKDGDFVPFDPPIHSRFGPISRSTRPILHQSSTIQVSACSSTDSVTTPTVHRPVPAISPMPQVLYHHQHPAGFAVGLVPFAPAPPNAPGTLEYMNTIGHGIIDPPHLHMSQLEPSGVRPTDPLVDIVNVSQEEQQRRQFIVAKEGIEALNLNQKEEEIRLKEELNLVLRGIIEKKREIELNNNEKGENSASEEDMKEFEKNWNFDFDEGEKD